MPKPGPATGLSIFFPAYNDSGTIASLVITALRTARKLTPDHEVIVVNDGSADGTAEILDERGWEGIIEDHDKEAPAAVDALIYSLAHAVGGHNPTQTVAIARNLQPGSAIKRVMRARQLGYLRTATKGRSGGLTNEVPA